MIVKEYQTFLKNELRFTAYLFLLLLVASLQLLKQAKLEVLAESLPIPIKFESRRKKIRRFLRLPNFTIDKIWVPCAKTLLEKMFNPGDRIYLAIDRTSWGLVNILMVSVIYDHRAWPLYWITLDKKGSSNLEEQKEVLRKSLEIVKDYLVVVLGDREFCSPKLGHWIGEQKVYFCLRQKCDTKIHEGNEVYKELREYGIQPGMKVFLNDRQVTKKKGFGSFNVACKWKRSYAGFKTKEPWYILTNFDDLHGAITAYQKRFSIEEMFRDFKSGGYNLEGSRLAPEYLSTLLIVVAIAYTSAMLQGRAIKKKGIQEYIARPETKSNKGRRHSAFYIGQHHYTWLMPSPMCEKIIEELLQINRRWVKFYRKGKRAMELAMSTLDDSLSPC
ncbi:IS4 family transposase [Okeania sp. SIO2B9]|uniref:IS4 family transposase n=1 Tax=Okeania sp. SIO2B9 TaxID=2607782 RepID=UPI001428DA24|nr:IS4 family transposase [Okeania sp. SIO2B9]NES93282.1 IS4 family transposase [Okeania sp. SIO2B9]